MNYLTLLFIYGKRQLRGGFLIALLIMPILVLGVKHFVPEQATSLRIGVMAESNDTFSRQLIDKLLSHKGYVTFVEEADEQDLITKVKNRTYECGYIIPQDIENRMNTLELKGAIVRGESPSAILSDVVDEIVFSKLLNLCGYQIANSLGKEYSLNTDNINKLYTQYINSDEVFSLAFEKIKTASAHSAPRTTTGSIATGLMAVYIMLGGLFGSLNWYKDEKKGIYVWGMGNVISATGLMCIFALLSQFMADKSDIIREIALMFVYFVAVCGYCCVVKSVFTSSISLCGALPVITIGALCFCPVVFNIGLVYPSLGQVGKIFVPYYYIDYVNGGSINGLVIVAVLCWTVYYGISLIKNKIS